MTQKIKEFENEIPTDHDHVNFFTTQEFNKLTSENVTRRLKQTNSEGKNDIPNFVKRNRF